MKDSMQPDMTIKKAIRRFFKRGIARLPDRLRHKVIRHFLRFDPNWSSRYNDDLVVKFATTSEEIGQSLELVREVYIERGFVKAEDPRVVSKYLFAESTRLVVALRGETVVGSLTLVQHDNPYGLPLERVFTVPPSLSKLGSLVEVTGLGISREFRREMQSSCLFLLMAFLYRYTSKQMNAAALLVTCLPRDSDFYKSILLFQTMEGRAYCEDYLGYPADCLALSLADAPARFSAIYSGGKMDLYDYLHQRPHRQLNLTDQPGPAEILARDDTKELLARSFGYSYHSP